MNGIKKTLALILSVMLLVGTLASCDMISAGGQKDNVDTSSYTAKVNIKFATDDEKMKSAVDAMNASSVIMVNNGDISVSTTSTSGNTTISEEYILVSDMLYYGLNVSIGDLSSGEYKRAPYGESRRLELISTVSGGAHIDNDDFNNVSVTNTANGKTFTCSGITDDAKDYLEGLMNEKFGGLATAKLSEAYLDLETKGTAPISSVLSCNYVITMGGVEYTVTMRLYTSYDYECETVVSAPSDTGKYVAVSFEEILK
jgi:hypothetical protein